MNRLRRWAWSWLTEGEMTGWQPEIGLGGTGPDKNIPECPVCWAYGGGGHGGYCPNGGGRPVVQWVSDPPSNRRSPERPESWHQ